MGVTTSIFDQTTIALVKTYLGTDDKQDSAPSRSAVYDVRAEDWNRIAAGLAEVAFRLRFGMLITAPFSHPNAAASWTDQEIYRHGGGDTALLYLVAPFAGSLIGLSVRTEGARTAGTLTAGWSKNGALQTLTTDIDGTDTQKSYASQVPQTETFDAGDEIGAMVTTDGTWAAGSTPSVQVDLLLSYRDE